MPHLYIKRKIYKYGITITKFYNEIFCKTGFHNFLRMYMLIIYY